MWSTDGTDDPLILDGVGVFPTDFASRARWSPDGRRVLVVGEGEARIKLVDPGLAQAWFRRHVIGCLPAEVRVSLLGEDPATAAASLQACEQGRSQAQGASP